MTASTGQGSGIRAVGGSILHAKELAAMTAWYGELFGMPIREIGPDQPFYAFDMEGGVDLMLDDHRFAEDQGKHPICMFKTADIGRTREWVVRSGIPIVLDMQRPHDGLAYFNVLDSEGNALMIVQSDWVNPDPARPMRGDHPIRNRVQSIVVPVTDLKRATEWYARLLGQAIKPERQDGGPIYWFDLEGGAGLLLDDNRQHLGWEKFPTFMLNARDIREAYRFATDRGVRTLTEIEFDHHFFAADPEGNSFIVCL
ncbi:VOC family protein [Cohnella xylanilytica]|uniref:VOC family protein n=1 Tax=Cohnella xylanilytica TaxID=557555 RepID=A0A841U7M1_9BACL|nr:VOC family protein [Cohnella xylanilytica]MBB6695859.1 VOC family protein [Cohnella xylanilytica]